MESVINPELQLAFNFVQFTNRNIFLTGKAGTGKTTFLHNMKKISPKRMIVVAPTGVAAINAGGVTIHSFFQLPFHPHLPTQYISAGAGEVSSQPTDSSSFKVSREKIRIMKSLDLLVIDEISMVRADLLDAVDSVLRKYKNRYQPFGGVQLLMIGDLQQLAPVVKEDDWEILGKYYHTAFFFGSLALRSTNYVTIELKHIYRQRDQAFINLLNKIRDNRLDAETLNILNKRYDPNFTPGSDSGYITLTTHNAQAQAINDSKLEKLPGKARSYEAIIKDEFPEYAYPTANELFLKAGAQVMFVKNDISPEKRYFNGKIGRIETFDEDVIVVQCLDDDSPIEVEVVEWQNMKYTLDEETREIKETVIGTFTQYPLKLAWAITIHKSQGLTFDNAIIDARAAFAHGQVYVALSRCRTLEGLVLSTQITRQGIISDPTVSGFVSEAEQNQPDENTLVESKKAYQQSLLAELFDFVLIQRNIQYCLKLLNEHKESIADEMPERFEKFSGLIRTELIEISVKFNREVSRLLAIQADAETNIQLQERISKACAFFADKLSEILAPVMNGISVEADNKAVRKPIADAVERIRQETFIRLSCLEACKPGFSIKKYLDAKTRAVLDMPAIKPQKTKLIEDSSGTVQHPGLYNRLKLWRDKQALHSNLPVYMILPLKTIASLVSFLPQTPASLKMIKGMGKMKTETFGNELIDIITAYCREQHIDPLPSMPVAEKKTAIVKPDTKRISYDLFKAGKSVVQIAEERFMAVTTIEGHLAYFVGTGELDIHEFVSPSMTALIASHFEGSGDYRMGTVKAALGEQISWSELRFVVKHLEHTRKTNPA